MKRTMSIFSPLVILAMTFTLPAFAAGGGGDTAAATINGPRVDTSSALVQLKGDPLATYVKTKPAQGKKIDFNNNTVKSYRAQLSALRNDFKAWLRANAPNAKVTGNFDIALNAVSVQLNGASLATIASAPMVQRAEYEGFYYPTIDPTIDPDLAVIHAVEAWAVSGGPGNAGEGVKVAILDTGIDITHPCFSDGGYATQTQLGDHRFTNNKVIAAKVFNNKTPSRGFTAEAIQAHGTHVAGTVACNFDTPATVDGVTIPHGISGIAPRALLGNYNIFPGNVLNARSEDILNALETAYADGFDVANMSLGGNASGIQDLLTIAVDNLDQADMVVAVAAGNAGPGHFTIESPGSAARALTAGAATVGHFIGAPVTVSGGPGAGTYPGMIGDFPTASANLTAPLKVVSEGSLVNGISNACSALTANLSGTIALVSRGTCSFSTKIRNGQSAGAAAVLVVNNVDGDGIAMGQDGTPSQPTIPAYMLSLSDGLLVKSSDGESTTIGVALQYFVSGNDDFISSFSGQGPTDVDFRVKPDVIAPGQNVLSSIPANFCASPPCFAFFQGTSMATPHLAGSAAVVRGQFPDFSAAEIRSAIVNTADQGVLHPSSPSASSTDVNIIGAGRENLLSAVSAKVALDPVSVSFGAVPSGSGQTRTLDLTLSNLTGVSMTVSLSVGTSTGTGVSYSVTPSVHIDGGASATVSVTMTANKGASFGDHQANLTISDSSGGEVAHAAVYTLIK
ncbi:MAG: S8 family serine peptidase [Acidithiobacillales bacterium]